MKLINDGKFGIFIFRIFKWKFELNIFLTEDCSTRLRNFILIEFKIWKYFKKPFELKLIKTYTNEKIKLICKS